MNIRTLTPSLEHSTPNLESIRSDRRQIKDSIFALDDIYLPVLKEKLNEFYSQLNRVEDSAREVLDRSPVALRSSGVRTVLQLLLETDASSPLRPGYVEEITDYLDSALERVTTLTDTLFSSLDRLNTFDPGETASFVSEMQMQIEHKQVDLASIELRQAATQKEKDTINEAMRYLEDKSFFDELLPLIEALKYLNPKDPASTAIEAGLAGVQNILRIASESVKYKDMVEARTEVQKSLETIKQEQRNTLQMIKTLTTHCEQLKTLESIKRCRTSYGQEVRKIGTTLSAFLKGQQNMSRDDMIEHARIFIAQANDMAVYLEDLSTRWK